MKRSSTLKRIASIICIGAICVSSMAGCSLNKATGKADNTNASATKEPPLKLTFMTQTTSGDPVKSDSEAMKIVEEYTNVKLNIIWVPSSSYSDKMNITLASGELPMVMYAGSKTSSIINAARSGAFWEIGPYLKNYTNLSKANPDILNNLSIDGKIYSLYRYRALGRNGVVYRKDWADAIGMKNPPSTIDEFYNMLKDFTTKDPDKNGKDDTYGMVLTSNQGPFDQISIWFGAPNGWGLDKSGKLVPAHLTDEYFNTMKFFKKLYDEKLINQDFPVVNASKWNDAVVQGKGGCIVDTLDRSNLLSQDIAKANPKAVIDVFGTIKGVNGEKLLPFGGGYAGFFVFPKQAIKDEATLKRVLSFMDKIGDKKPMDTMRYGVEGRHWKLTSDGKMDVFNDPNIPKNEYQDFNQLLTYIGDQTPQKQNELQSKVSKLQTDDEKFVVNNPAMPYSSNTYSTKGAQLDNIIQDAKTQYIVGKIDEAGWKAAVDLWKKSGGDDYIKEINAEYAKYKK